VFSVAVGGWLLDQLMVCMAPSGGPGSLGGGYWGDDPCVLRCLCKSIFERNNQVKGHHLKLMHVGLLTYMGYISESHYVLLNLGQMCDV